MKYCLQCGSEYREGTDECADCPGVRLVSASEKGGALKPSAPGGSDHSVFVEAGTAEDPLLAERLERALLEQRIPTQLRQMQGATVDRLTDGLPLPWWEIWVPRAYQGRAAELIEQQKAQVEKEAPEAERAAEAEALEAAP